MVDKFKLLSKFIQREVENSDDQYKLSINETKEVFKNAIRVVEEISGTEIDDVKFNEFLTFYKIMKIVESVCEELRSDKYIADMRNRVHNKSGDNHYD